MEYYAHRVIDENGKEHRQTVLAHLFGTSERCAGFAKAFGAEEQGELTGLAHDIGKFSLSFQKRLLENGAKVDHSSAGAAECMKLGQVPAAFAVAGHHGGLPDGGSRGDRPDAATLNGRIRRAALGRLPSYDAWREQLKLPSAALPSFCFADSFAPDFFTRMLFSCLVDADYLDTEAFMDGRPRQTGAADMDQLFDRLSTYISKWFPPEGELNQRRCAILESCLKAGSKVDQGLFTLSVPTGGGKTVASLAFALAHARAQKLERVIYVIPYTSIIEQTANTFREILGSDAVLEHHCNVRFEPDENGELSGENLRLSQATENWDMPVIVTTAVQFFESLYSNKPSQCRKLHNIANSVIIFDEAQMLPLPYLRPCVSAISQLLAHYGVSAVLCTATQPALTPMFREFIPDLPVMELCPAVLSEDAIFRRVQFCRGGKRSWDELAAEMNAMSQVLCIVNSRKNAAKLYDRIKGEGCFHLSTLMVPQHRRQVLNEIRQRLPKQVCRVVATSLIEAGVDVDFPAVFREEAGLDSLLQAAGRCNREGGRPAAESIVTVFQAENRPPLLFQTSIDFGRMAMNAYDDIACPEAIAFYFTKLRAALGNSSLDRNQIMAKLSCGSLPFRTVAEQFRLIDNNTRTIYIPWQDGAERVARLQAGERSRQLFRELGQYSVSVYEQHYRQLDMAGVLEPLEDGSSILRDMNLYSQETGLTLEPESGQAEFI